MSDPSYALDRALTYRLHRLHKLIDLQSQRFYPESTGLSLSDGRCLGAIGAFGPLSINDLANRANLDKGQASRAAQSLVDQGLVSKRTCREDGRGVVLNLTVPGKKVWIKTMKMIDQRNQEVFGTLSAREIEQLSRLLDKLLQQNEKSPLSPKP